MPNTADKISQVAKRDNKINYHAVAAGGGCFVRFLLALFWNKS
jgi:hypothetical protein